VAVIPPRLRRARPERRHEENCSHSSTDCCHAKTPS
jgi:hypothetical protein